MWNGGLEVVILIIAVVCGMAWCAKADAPYFGQSERITHPEFATVEFAILFGDGIIGANPSQVVVIDNDGFLLASAPLSIAHKVIWCSRTQVAPICIA